MRAAPVYSTLIVVTSLMLGAADVSAELKRVPYPVVKVELGKAFAPDAAFEKMHKSFADASKSRDANALFALVAPGFVWTADGALANDYNPGRDALHNFKVLFGFRQLGKDTDGGVKDGPFWDTLAAFANDDSYYRTEDSSGMVCSPMAATVEDDDVLAQARDKIETANDASDWYYTVRPTPVAKAPGDKGAPIAMLNAQAVPILSTYPAARQNQPAPIPTHYEVLLPSGKSGWIPAASVRALQGDQLCYALTVKGDWMIALYDGGQSQQQGDE